MAWVGLKRRRLCLGSDGIGAGEGTKGIVSKA